jgi:hypothetical protein
MVNSTSSVLLAIALVFGLAQISDGFSVSRATGKIGCQLSLKASKSSDAIHDNSSRDICRRSILTSTVLAGSSMLLGGLNIGPANAAVGTLPEFADTNAIVQGITVNVADQSQQTQMIQFLTGAFDFQVLRRRIKDSVEDTVGRHGLSFSS